MKPILYEQTETAFTSQGIGVLADALKCVVTEELNNVFDLEMTYPVTGVLFKSLTLRRIIKAKPNQTDNPQPFRIYKITKPMNGSVTVLAHHISYDLSGMVVPPFTVQTPAAVVATIVATALPTIQPFYFQNNVTGNAEYKSERPVSARSILSGFTNVYGGEYSYDNKLIKIDVRRGSDKGAVISYGKNLMDLKQEENCAEMYTLVYPFYHNDGNLVTLPEKTIRVPGRFDHDRVLALDLTQSFPDAVPTETELRTKTYRYITEEKVGYPKVNLTISYLSIEDSDEAIPLHMFEGIALGDDVKVRFEKLNIDADSRCIKYVYDAVRERVDSIEIGDKSETFIDTTAKQYSAVTKGEYQAFIQDAITAATQLITNGLGGYVILHRSNASLSAPDELLILGDSPDLSEARQVWRWNKNGLGYSSTGYNGTYSTAMTADGSIVADRITTGILSAIEITNGNGTFHVTSNGVMTATSGTIGGFHIASNGIYNDAIQFDNTGVSIRNGSSLIGSFRKMTSNSVGLQLNSGGTTIGWYNVKSDGTVEPIIEYNRNSDNIQIYKDVTVQSQAIYNCSGVHGGSSGATNYVYHSRITVETGTPGYMTIVTYRTGFNNYGQYVSTSQVSSYRYELRDISLV